MLYILMLININNIYIKAFLNEMTLGAETSCQNSLMVEITGDCATFLCVL